MPVGASCMPVHDWLVHNLLWWQHVWPAWLETPLDAGLGITLFGASYMFVHDGLVHKRFPVGPIADVPALKRIAVAHKLHHAERYGGVPWGLFLGPQELEAVGAKAELDRLCRDLDSAK